MYSGDTRGQGLQTGWSRILNFCFFSKIIGLYNGDLAISIKIISSETARDNNLNFILEILGAKAYKLAAAEFWFFFFFPKLLFNIVLWDISIKCLCSQTYNQICFRIVRLSRVFGPVSYRTIGPIFCFLIRSFLAFLWPLNDLFGRFLTCPAFPSLWSKGIAKTKD